jgi:hypothetical protein
LKHTTHTTLIAYFQNKTKCFPMHIGIVFLALFLQPHLKRTRLKEDQHNNKKTQQQIYNIEHQDIQTMGEGEE